MQSLPEPSRITVHDEAGRAWEGHGATLGAAVHDLERRHAAAQACAETRWRLTRLGWEAVARLRREARRG
jgi:hypothetical protein